jgi:hypothetical protein
VKEPRHDDERLSALLAGRLEGPERDELLAYLSTADEDLEVFAHTAAILREMDEEDAREEQDKKPDPKAAHPPPGKAPVPSMSKSTRGWPRRTPRWAIVPAVAGLAVLVVLGWLAWPGRGAPDVSPLRLAMNIEDSGTGLPFDAARPSAGIPGNATRGEGDAARTPESAARAGAFLVRLALAIQARDTAATATLALQAQRFDPRGAGALREIETRAGRPAADLQPLLEQATERLEGRLGADYLRLGAWTEAGFWAARRRDAGYFRSPDSVAMLRFAEDLTEDDRREREAVAAVRRELAAEQPDWVSLERKLAAMLNAIAS